MERQNITWQQRGINCGIALNSDFKGLSEATTWKFDSRGQSSDQKSIIIIIIVAFIVVVIIIKQVWVVLGKSQLANNVMIRGDTPRTTTTLQYVHQGRQTPMNTPEPLQVPPRNANLLKHPVNASQTVSFGKEILAVRIFVDTFSSACGTSHQKILKRHSQRFRATFQLLTYSSVNYHGC